MLVQPRPVTVSYFQSKLTIVHFEILYMSKMSEIDTTTGLHMSKKPKLEQSILKCLKTFVYV